MDESAICCGANCCLIDGQCFQRGEMNPANSCEQCNPSAGQTSWSPVSGCGVDAGGVAPPADAAADPAPDAAAPQADAGNTGAPDAGTEPTDDGGCLAVGPAFSHPVHWGLVALLALGFVGRRARRSRRDAQP